MVTATLSSDFRVEVKAVVLGELVFGVGHVSRIIKIIQKLICWGYPLRGQGKCEGRQPSDTNAQAFDPTSFHLFCVERGATGLKAANPPPRGVYSL